jgi:hypothetical protein
MKGNSMKNIENNNVMDNKKEGEKMNKESNNNKVIGKIVASLTVLLVVAGIAIVGLNQQVDANVQDDAKTNEQWQTEDALTFHSYLDGISLNQVSLGRSGPVWAGDPTDPDGIFNNAKNIAIITVTSLDGAYRMVDGHMLMYPATYGKVFVNKVLAGNLPEKEEINFVRSGAIMKVKDYYAGAPDTEKPNYLREQSGQPRVENDESYIGSFVGSDAPVEVGKTYLAYIKQKPNTNEYAIVGYQWGALALDGVPTSQFLSRSAEPDLSAATLQDTCLEVRGSDCDRPTSMSYAEYFDKYIKDKQ